MLGWILPAPKGFAARARFLLLEIATICPNEFSAIFFLSLTYNVLVNTPSSMPPRKTQLPAVPVQEPGTPSKTGTPIRRPSGGESELTWCCLCRRVSSGQVLPSRIQYCLRPVMGLHLHCSDVARTWSVFHSVFVCSCCSSTPAIGLGPCRVLPPPFLEGS